MNEIGLNINVDSYNNEGIKTIKGNNNAEIYKLYILKNKRRLSLVGNTVKLGYVMVGTTNGDVIENLNITNAEQGEITFPITNRISKKDGVYSCQLAIYGADGFLEHTATFGLTVEANIFTKIAGEIENSKDLTYIERILEEAKTVSGDLKTNIPVAFNLNTSLESNINNANTVNQTLMATTEQSKVAATEATQKKSELESSLEETKKFIEGLDGSQNIPQIRMDVTELQNGLKSNQFLAYADQSSYSIENSLDGMTTDMIIRGRTLQNLIKNESYDLKSLPITLENNYFTFTTNDNFYFRNIISSEKNLEPSKEYTVIYEVEENTLLEGNYVEVCNTTNFNSSVVIDSVTKRGIYSKRVLTKSQLNEAGHALYFNSRMNNASGQVLKLRVMLVKGNLTDIPEYFEGIKSFGEQESNKISILSCGKNLLDVNDLYNTLKDISNNGIFEEEKDGRDCIKITQLSNYWNKGYEKIKFKEKTQYTFTGTAYHNSSNWTILSIKYTDGSSLDIRISPNEWTKFNFTSDANKTIKGIFSAYTTDTFAYIDKNTFMIEEGEHATKFEQYKSYKKDILIKEPLRSVGNISDVMYEDNGKVKINRYVKEYTFTGDEVIGQWANSNDACWFTINSDSFAFNYNSSNDNLICNNFIGYAHGYFSSSNPIQEGLEGITVNSNYFTIRIKKNKLSSVDVSGFKAWLKANPTTIVYQLTTPTVEIVENCVDIDLDTFIEKTYFNILNSLPGTLDFKVPSNIGSVVQNMAKEVNNIWDVINNLLVPSIVKANGNLAMLKLNNNLN